MIALVTAVASAGVLAGCVSTQTKNARTLLVNQRTLDSETALRVSRIDPQITVAAVGLIRSGDGTAIVVRLRNGASHPVSDLPISVGIVARGGRRRYLNASANLAYFDTHVASIGPRATALWVLTSHGRTPPGARPFADVGEPGLPASTRDRSVPLMRVLAGAAAAGGLRVAVVNPSGIPQYGLPVYAVQGRGDRFLAAGSATVATLDGGARTTLGVHLLGAVTGAPLQLSAPATIFN